MSENKTKHTPAPWELESSEDGSWEISADGAVVAARNRWKHRFSESLANARLISAAPELLEALKEMRDFLIQIGLVGAVVEAANSAITKAEGKS